MKGYERRAAGAETYYKLATWDARSFTFRDGRVAYPTATAARAAAKKPGRYRISTVSPDGRTDGAAFDV